MHEQIGNLQAEKRAMGVSVAREDRPEGGYLARLTIDNAAKLNSLNRELMLEIVDAVKALEAEPELRLVIVTGAGDRAFIGGADINELAALDPDSAREFITLVHRCCGGFHRLPVPVIARIDGYALGGGLELAAACDLRVASDRAVFGMPEVRVGIPSVVEAALLPQLIGWGRTKLLVYTGDNIDARTALEWGLVEKVVPAAELDAARAAVALWRKQQAEGGAHHALAGNGQGARSGYLGKLRRPGHDRRSRHSTDGRRRRRHGRRWPAGNAGADR